MDVSEFMRSVTTADFSNMIKDQDELRKFIAFIDEREQRGDEYVIVRFLFEVTNEDDGVPRPFYMWATYPLRGADGVVDIYPPDFDDPATSLHVPDELMDKEFFPIYIGEEAA